MINQINNIVDKIIFEALAKQDIFLKEQLKFALPPIKGKITFGKLKWRGIKLIQINDMNANITWLEQRGKQIGEKFYIEIDKL